MRLSLGIARHITHHENLPYAEEELTYTYLKEDLLQCCHRDAVAANVESRRLRHAR